MRNIMLATDGSDSADEALDLAIEIARDAGATLRILSVRPPKRSTHDEGRLRAVEEVGGAQRIADASATRARQAGVEATSDVAHGDVVTSIVDAAEALSADLLVVGSRGHSLSEGPAVLGSVSQALVRNSPVPVTVVRQATRHPRSPATDRSTATPEPTVPSWSMFE